MHARFFIGLAVLVLVGCPACISGAVDDSNDVTDDARTSDVIVNSDGESGDSGTVIGEDTGAAAETSEPADVAVDTAPACVAPMKACSVASECCAGLSCDTTTLGRVCCGNAGATCTTAGGEDCCGDLLCVSGKCVSPDAAPDFAAPYPCGESWTYSHHSAEVRLALDYIDNSGTTNGSPVLASAPGRATRHYQAGGAGNYIVIDHGGGWKTYYFHLQSYSVADGTTVTRGREVGRVGSTGASSGPHLHYEQLKNGVGQTIKFHGVSLAPYPGTYGVKSATSKNCP
jgi:hypothetical protein